MTTNDKKGTVLVAMSGGVDSSVAAALLKEEGYDVIGVTMNLWDYDRVGGNINKDSGCCSIDTMDDARCVCSTLGIPYYVVNFRDEFDAAVQNDFMSEYMAGRTPNPCVRCNTFIKWGVLLEKAEELGAEYLATGHYARTGYDETRQRFFLKQGLDGNKDQSYALWGIKQAGLKRTLFPVGGYTKSEIRDIARRIGLRTAEKAESQEICFIPDNDYARYLKSRNPELTALDGDIVNGDGAVIGRHKGYPFYTIGQRKGLGLSMPEPVYVTDIDPAKNLVTIGSNQDLEHTGLLAEKVNWVSLPAPDSELRVQIKIRYNSPATDGVLWTSKNGNVEVKFDNPQRAVTPGQSVVFYQDDLVVAGAIIRSFTRA
jgi:tRNA-specific 2-thiouridylase